MAGGERPRHWNAPTSYKSRTISNSLQKSLSTTVGPNPLRLWVVPRKFQHQVPSSNESDVWPSLYAFTAFLLQVGSLDW